MSFIHIKKIQSHDPETGMREQFAVPSVAIATPQGRMLIPNPSGNEASLFDTLAEAEDAIRRAGFDYVYEGRKTYTLKSEARDNEPLAFSNGRPLEDAVPLLVARLKDREATVVANAAFALGSLKAYGALEQLAAILGHDDPTVRKQVAEAMARMSRTALPYLKDAFEEARTSAAKNAPYVRLTVMSAFLEMTYQPGVNAMLLEQLLPLALEALNDESWLVRAQAALVIGRAAEAIEEEKGRMEQRKKLK